LARRYEYHCRICGSVNETGENAERHLKARHIAELADQYIMEVSV